MVSLPVSRQTKSSTMARNSDSLSPVFKSTRISTIMGTITSIHPERISERVPSKSKRATRAADADASVRISSSILYQVLLLQPVFPFSGNDHVGAEARVGHGVGQDQIAQALRANHPGVVDHSRSEEHTSELQ